MIGWGPLLIPNRNASLEFTLWRSIRSSGSPRAPLRLDCRSMTRQYGAKSRSSPNIMRCAGGRGHVAGFSAAGSELARRHSGRHGRSVLVLRDYHVDNLMVIPDRGDLACSFQDALAGHRAYDLVSLLQDARREVSPEIEEAMIARYAAAAGVRDAGRFRAHYEVLGAQRNTKILGIFTRLWKRDGKANYLPFQPRVWRYLERNLKHPALAPVRDWFDHSIPTDKRAPAWEAYR